MMIFPPHLVQMLQQQMAAAQPQQMGQPMAFGAPQGFGGPKGAGQFPMAPNTPFQPRPFEGFGMPSLMGGPKGSTQLPFAPMAPQMQGGMLNHPNTQQWLQQLFSNFQMPGGPAMAQLPGTNSGGQGARGPNPSPFGGLNKFSGPFGNGGGPIAPGFQQY